MNSLYYTSEIPIGENGEKMILLHIDSPFLLCETVGKDHKRYLSLSNSNRNLYDS